MPGALSGTKSTILTAAVVVAKASPIGLGIASGISGVQFAKDMAACGKYTRLGLELERNHPVLRDARKARAGSQKAQDAQNRIDADENLRHAAAQHAEYESSRKHHKNAAISSGLRTAGTAALIVPSTVVYGAAVGAAVKGAALPAAIVGFAAITPGLIIASKLNIYLEFGIRRELAESLAEHADGLHLHIVNYNDLQHEIAKYEAVPEADREGAFATVLAHKQRVAAELKENIQARLSRFMESLDQKEASKDRVYRANECVKLAKEYKTSVKSSTKQEMSFGYRNWVRSTEYLRSEAVDGLRFGTFNLFEGACNRLSARTARRNADAYRNVVSDSRRLDAIEKLNGKLKAVDDNAAREYVRPVNLDGTEEHLETLLPALESYPAVGRQVIRLLSNKMLAGKALRKKYLPLAAGLTDIEYKTLIEELTAAGKAEHCDVGACPQTFAWMRGVAASDSAEDRKQLGDQIASRFDQYMLNNVRRDAKGDRRYYARYVQAYETVERRAAQAAVPDVVPSM